MYIFRRVHYVNIFNCIKDSHEVSDLTVDTLQNCPQIKSKLLLKVETHEFITFNRVNQERFSTFQMIADIHLGNVKYYFEKAEKNRFQ